MKTQCNRTRQIQNEKLPTKPAKGFTLIEMVVVITILAILAAVALPRFAEIADEAHHAAIEGAAGGLASAVTLVRSQWLVLGRKGARANLPGYGNETVDVSVDGWPTGVNGNTDPGGMSAAECNALWTALLQSNAPDVSTSPGSDYQASVSGNVCRYTYQLDAAGSHIDYDPASGEVSSTLN
ncbi:MAG: pilin [Proteobacteria bacterium]|nr:MAG: pilin [Pseudomonadota bacterium]